MDKIVVHNKLVLHSKRADYLEVFLPILSIFIVSCSSSHDDVVRSGTDRKSTKQSQ